MKRSKSKLLLMLLMLLIITPTKAKADAVYWDASISANGDTVTVEIVLAEHRNGSIVLKANSNYLTTPEVAFKDAIPNFDVIPESDCYTNFTNNSDGSTDITYSCTKDRVDKIEVTYKIKKRFEKTAVTIFVSGGYPRSGDIELELYKCDQCKTEPCNCDPCNCESKDNTENINENNDKNSNILTYILIGTNFITLLGLISTIIIVIKTKKQTIN